MHAWSQKFTKLMVTNPSSQTHPIRDSLGSPRLCHMNFCHYLPNKKPKNLFFLNPIFFSFHFINCFPEFIFPLLKMLFLFSIIRQSQVSFPTCRPCTLDFLLLLFWAPLLMGSPDSSAVTKVHFGLTRMK